MQFELDLYMSYIVAYLEICWVWTCEDHDDSERIKSYMSSSLLQGICDGAGAVILASAEAVAAHNLTPLARLVGYGVAGWVNQCLLEMLV